MPVHEIAAKTLLRKQKKIDSWFLSRYGMNIYRGCTHACLYCDGRDEKYRVDGDFGSDIITKINAPDLLRRELDPVRKRVPLKRGYIFIGGGVSDAYQPAEEKYCLALRCLQVLAEHSFPVHILTKSVMVERDIDLLCAINAQSRAIVSFSFSSANDGISRQFEPGASPPSERLACIRRFKARGIACGMMLMPVIPFVTDLPAMVEETIARAHEAGVDFVIYGGMTLKRGAQMDCFMHALRVSYPALENQYAIIYGQDQWGRASEEYTRVLDETIWPALKRRGIPARIPPRLFTGLIDRGDQVIAMLEHIDWRLRSQGYSSPYGYAAYQLSQLKQPLETMQGKFRQIRGVGPGVEKVIEELLRTGTCGLYRKTIGE